jgi:hypothetical protein
MQQIAATQIRALLKRRPPHPGEVPIFVFGAVDDAVQLAQWLRDLPRALLVRWRSNRCFYAEPTEREPGGRPRRHGAKFARSDPRTWWNPNLEYVTNDSQYGEVHVQAWTNLHAKPDKHPTRGTCQPRSVIPGTLIRISVSTLPKQTQAPKPRLPLVVWASFTRPGMCLESLSCPVSMRAHIEVL